jgi:putative ABC transport system ATP-binding protein
LPPVLDVPAFSVKKGRRVFLHGPSGSGKTTLLGVLSGILEATAGQVSVLGHDYRTLKGRARDAFRGAHVGYVFQMFNLIPYLDVQENILLPLRLSPERRARLGGVSLEMAADGLAARLGISSLLKRPVTELSVGQQQRVAAARALAGSPELIIADEPTSALDTDHREAFITLLFDEAARSGSSILFVSHDRSLMPLFQDVISLGDINRCSPRV